MAIWSKSPMKNVSVFGSSMCAALAYARKSKAMGVRAVQTKDRGWIVEEWL
ncbi:MAG: hypothetical protein WCF85_18485 [Rhodospirillaceae bacterium]